MDNHLSSSEIDAILSGILRSSPPSTSIPDEFLPEPFSQANAAPETRTPEPQMPFPAPQTDVITPNPAEPQGIVPGVPAPNRVVSSQIFRYTENEYRQRFAGAEWAQRIADRTATIIGVGGIGSWTALLVARFGVPFIRLVDGDTVESSNISGQLYRLQDVGRSKVSALSWTIGEFSDNTGVATYATRVTGSSAPDIIQQITICGLDSMSSRKEVFALWKRVIGLKPADERKNYLFIDGRLSFETLQVFAFRGDQQYYINKYESEYLFNDNQADATVCSMKQTSYMANMIASFISNIIVHDCMNSPVTTPFLIEYDSDLFGLRVIR